MNYTGQTKINFYINNKNSDTHFFQVLVHVLRKEETLWRNQIALVYRAGFSIALSP